MLEADTVDDVESKRALSVKVSLCLLAGYAADSMREKLHNPRGTWGGPKHSCKGILSSKLQRRSDNRLSEVELPNIPANDTPYLFSMLHPPRPNTPPFAAEGLISINKEHDFL